MKEEVMYGHPHAPCSALACVLAATVLLSSCGGASSPTGGTSSSSSAVPTEQAKSLAGTPLLQLHLASTVGGSLLPFTVGQPLRQGDVPAGSVLVADGVPELQFVVKNRWPDGSAKFAVLAGRADLGTGAWRSIGLSVASEAQAAFGPALGLADLQATGVTARVDFGAFGTAGWNAGDWDTPFRTVLTGPQMSAWTFRKPIGGDAHLVAWLEVRAYKGGRVEVLPWIENGYLNVPGPTEKIDTATFTLGGSERFSQPLALLNHQRAVLAGPSTLTHWFNGADPQVTPRHDTAYFMATRLVPNYGAVTPSDSPLYSRLPTEYTPLMLGSYPSGMGSTGYHPSIGLLPEWDVAYLSTQGDPRAYRSVIINGYAAGRFGTHFRDEKTNRPLVFESYPYLVMREGSGVSDLGGSSKYTYTPWVTGATPPGYKTSHHPSMGYMAYLVSGWNYFVEETQLVATTNFLKFPDKTRGYTQGLYLSGGDSAQTRSSAWTIRTLAQAATITPDDDPLRQQFIDAVGNNITAYHSRYVAQPNNPLGVVEDYGSDSSVPGVQYNGKPWMDDFLTATTAYVKELAAYSPAIEPQLNGFLTWKFRSVSGRLGGGGQDEFAYTHGAQYILPYAKSHPADWKGGTGPWFNSWGEVARYLGVPTGVAAGAPLETGYATAASGFWSNLMPALSYAVDMGAPGAAEGWARVSSASNFPEQLANYNDTPVWSVRPRTVPLATTGGTTATPLPPAPAVTLKSIEDLPPGQWLELPNTKLRPIMPLPILGNAATVTTGYSGGAVDQTRARLLVWGGGSTGYYGNDLYALDLPSLSVQRVAEPSASGLQSGVNGVCGAALADGNPRARSTYDGLTYIPELDSFFAVAGFLSYCNDGTPNGSGGVWLRDFTNNQWVMKRSNTPLPYEYGVMAKYDKATGLVLIKSTRDFRSYSPQTDTFTLLNANAPGDYRMSATIDTRRHRFVMLGLGKVQVIDLASNQMTTLATTNVPALVGQASPGVAYDPVADRIVAWHGGSEVWALDMDTLSWSQVAVNAGPQASAPGSGTFGRWGYVEKYNVFALVNSVDENAWVFRLASRPDATITP